jgi:NarL family two-component system response regulator YdfI
MNPPIPAAEAASSPTSANPLTTSEQQILQLTAEGHTAKHIARAMGISEHTVKYHVKSIHRKLGVASRTQAVAIALRNGWL